MKSLADLFARAKAQCVDCIYFRPGDGVYTINTCTIQNEDSSYSVRAVYSYFCCSQFSPNLDRFYFQCPVCFYGEFVIEDALMKCLDCGSKFGLVDYFENLR